ncbi:MAG: LytTR family DNA-binding domain-containing protein [Oscillospiraceae bacterium]|jgi:response regulator of the lytR/algR family
MITIFICDDDNIYLNKLEEYFYKFFEENSLNYELKAFTDSKVLLQSIKKKICDILVLDIDMPEINGIEIAKYIRNFNSDITLIFITNMEHLVFESVKYTPYRFIRKSKIHQEISELMNALQNKFAEEGTMFQFTCNDEIKRIKLTEIVYFESVKHDIYVHDFYENEYKIKNSLNELIQNYGSAGFIKIHKSYIVNYRYIFEIKRDSIILDNKMNLPLGKNRITEIKRQYANFTRREMQ